MKYKANPIEVTAEKIFDVRAVRGDGVIPVIVYGQDDPEGVTPDMTAAYFPKPGDYIVTQANGSKVLYPRQVFESYFTQEA